MNASVRTSLSDIIRNSPNPVLKGKAILEEEYRKGGGVGEFSASASANFEIVRSLIVQAAYEAATDPDSAGWLNAGTIGLELEDAREARWYRIMDGLAYALKDVPEAVFDKDRRAELLALESEAISERRFLGAMREYVPGVGYAVSIRKRTSENQDSLMISGNGKRKVLAVADGVSSERFAAMASHVCVRDMEADFSKAGIISISERMGAGMNKDDYRILKGKAMGTSTLLAAEISGNAKRVFRVGDSIGFSTYEGVVQELAEESGLIHVVGYKGLEEGHIEEFSADGAQLILTTDGFTNYVNDAGYLLAKITAITTDAVIIAERMIRAALSNQTMWDHADDLTVLVEEMR